MMCLENIVIISLACVSYCRNVRTDYVNCTVCIFNQMMRAFLHDNIHGLVSS